MCFSFVVVDCISLMVKWDCMLSATTHLKSPRCYAKAQFVFVFVLVFCFVLCCKKVDEARVTSIGFHEHDDKTVPKAKSTMADDAPVVRLPGAVHLC